MPRFKLTVEYNGTRYSGWQIQKNARTIQGEIDRAVGAVTGRKDFELYGSGRTDAGVHALGQVAHLDVSTGIRPAALVQRINEELPADINVLSAVVVPHRFHARHDATGRRYLYQIATRRTALAKPFVWWVKEPLDLGRMGEAARLLVGMRDFRAFAAQDRTDTEEKSTIVLIDRIDVAPAGDLILVAIEGSHFLWKMVRRIVGVLVEVARGRIDAASVTALPETGSGAPARVTAPSSGLFLERVYYAGDARPSVPQAATPFHVASDRL